MKGAGWLVLLGLVACGERAVDGHYRGEVLFAIDGFVSVTGDARGAGGELRVALFWARPGGAGAPLDTVTAVEQKVGAATSFPARVTLTVHAAPADDLIGTSSDVDGGYALATLLVYLDSDGDRRWQRGSEPLVGAAPDALVVYAPDGLGGGRFGALGAGFQLMRGASAGACGATLAAAAPRDVPIVVDMRFPAAVLGDVDCDGAAEEWSGTCPAPATVWAECRNGATSELCQTCEPLLWSQGSSDPGCDSWLGACEGFEQADECEEAWEHCREEGADGEPEPDTSVAPPDADVGEEPEPDAGEEPEPDASEGPEEPDGG